MNVYDWLQMLSSYVVQLSLVVAVAWVLDAWSSSSATKAKIWTACFLSLIGLMFAGLMLPRLQLLHPWSQLEPARLLSVAETQHVVGRSLLVIWALGTSVMLVRWTWHYRRLNHFIQGCDRFSDDKLGLISKLIEPKQLIVAGRDVQFRYCDESLGPFCYQLHQPMVFLPRSLVEGDRTELTYVLRHELAHLHTQHPVQLLLQRIVQTICWFHPLVWISGRRAALVREFVCDESVTANGASTAAYLRTLLRLVESRPTSQSGTFAIGRSAGELRQRARRIAGLNGERGRKWTWGAILPVVASALMASQLWLPTNPVAAAAQTWSPWPGWTAATLHTFGVSVRDYEAQHDCQVHELLEELEERTNSSAADED